MWDFKDASISARQTRLPISSSKPGSIQNSAVVCVGGKLEERRQKGTEPGFLNKAAFSGISGNDACKVTIAYEPVWAIGTGKTATPEQANEMCSCIRETLTEIYDEETADKIVIQYGGSVKPENATEIMNMEEIDGALVGGASLDPLKFIEIVNF
ncbi:MAG: triose-phosphate isomerase family protein [Anaerovoracaceae bacterium]